MHLVKCFNLRIFQGRTFVFDNADGETVYKKQDVRPPLVSVLKSKLLRTRKLVLLGLFVVNQRQVTLTPLLLKINRPLPSKVIEKLLVARDAWLDALDFLENIAHAGSRHHRLIQLDELLPCNRQKERLPQTTISPLQRLRRRYVFPADADEIVDKSNLNVTLFTK